MPGICLASEYAEFIKLCKLAAAEWGMDSPTHCCIHHPPKKRDRILTRHAREGAAREGPGANVIVTCGIP